MTAIPPVLTLSKLCELLSLTPRTVYDHRRRKDHPGIVELPQFVGGHPRFDGRALTAWLEGGPRAVRRGPRQPGTSLLSVQRRRVG